MTPQDILTIRAHVALLKGQEEAFAADFYARLFEIAPQVRAMFRHDMAEQGRKLMTVLAFAVGALDRPDVLAPAVRRLGAQHAGYGVEMAHFQPVGAALLHTLAKWLGPGFDDAARAAWTRAITALAGLMAEGLDAARAQAA